MKNLRQRSASSLEVDHDRQVHKAVHEGKEADDGEVDHVVLDHQQLLGQVKDCFGAELRHLAAKSFCASCAVLVLNCCAWTSRSTRPRSKQCKHRMQTAPSHDSVS